MSSPEERDIAEETDSGLYIENVTLSEAMEKLHDPTRHSNEVAVMPMAEIRDPQKESVEAEIMGIKDAVEHARDVEVKESRVKNVGVQCPPQTSQDVKVVCWNACRPHSLSDTCAPHPMLMQIACHLQYMMGTVTPEDVKQACQHFGRATRKDKSIEWCVKDVVNSWVVPANQKWRIAESYAYDHVKGHSHEMPYGLLEILRQIAITSPDCETFHLAVLGILLTNGRLAEYLRQVFDRKFATSYVHCGLNNNWGDLFWTANETVRDMDVPAPHVHPRYSGQKRPRLSNLNL